MTSGGSTTAYWEYGNPDSSAPPIVMVHGFRGDHHGLESLASRLEAYRVIVPDLPGFGKSEPLVGEHRLEAFADWLMRFVNDLALDRFVIVGHSFGSLIVSCAVSRGLSPEVLVLLNPISAPALKGPRSVLTRGALAYYELGKVLPSGMADALLRSPAIVRLMSEVMAKTRNRELRAWIHDQHAQFFSQYSDRHSLLEAFRASVSHTVSEYAGSLTMPTLLVCGSLDDISPLEDQLKFARMLPSAEFHVVRGVGHLVHYEGVAESTRVLTRFLEEHVALAAHVASRC